MSSKERLYYRFYNSILIRNTICATFIDWIIDTINIFKAVFGIKSAFVGQKRFIYRVYYYLCEKYDCLTLKPSGIYHKDKLLDNQHFHIMDFMPMEGLEINEKKLDGIKDIIEKIPLKKDESISVKYYRTRGIFKFVTLGFIITYFFAFYILFKPNSYIPLYTKIFSSLWLLPSSYFFIETIFFFICRQKHISMSVSFEEAGVEEERNLLKDKNQPSVITVVPTFMEDHNLLKRTLYSLCLQDYTNMHVVMLLGNDYYSSDTEVIEKTRQMRHLVIDVKRDLKNQRVKIRKCMKEPDLKRIDSAKKLEEEMIAIGSLYKEVSGWFMEKARDIKKSEIKYPIDKFVIENTFVLRYVYFKRRSFECLRLVSRLNDTDMSKESFLPYFKRLTEFYNELNRLFKITLEVFMRTKYENMEQEKTKAGNLSAYTSIIGGKWIRKRQQSGKYVLVRSDRGKYIKEPDFLASFDSDTIPKSNYIVRKVAYLKRNRKVGLIQSPYSIPIPELTNVGSAAGTLSYWFLPISIALTSFKSAYWLGFNGVMRYEAVRKISNFLTQTIIEDTQNSIKIMRAGYEVITSAEEQCVTYSPINLRALKIQRIRWASGGFQIARDIIKGFSKGEKCYDTLLSKVLAFNYVLGLNLLPIAITCMFIFRSPFYNKYYFIETIPFLVSLIPYGTLLMSLTSYRFKHFLDGLAVSLFTYLYYMAGTVNSIKSFIFGEGTKYFNTTPRSRDNQDNSLENLEFFGMMTIVIILGLKICYLLQFDIYCEIMPVFNLFLALYGIYRFRNNGETRLVSRRNNNSENKAVVFNKPFYKEKRMGILNRTMRVSFIMTAVIVICVVPVVVKAVEYNNLNNIKKEVTLNLYEKNSFKTPLNSFEQGRRLGRGINLGNCLDAPEEGEWGVKLKDEYFKIIKEAGFATIRVPVNWSDHSQKNKPYKINETFIERIDWVLLNAKKNNLNVVLDFHSYTGINENYRKHYDRFMGIWTQIAKRYKDCDSSLYYEILNEPCKDLNEVWNRFVADTINEIRKVDTYHTLIISGANVGNANSLKPLKIPKEEQNVVCSFHTYYPSAFTHQGADFSTREFRLLKNVKWPGPPSEPLKIEKSLLKVEWLRNWVNNYNTLPYETNPAGPKIILEELDLVLNWSRDNNRPVWLGEFGAIRKADMESRERWTSFIVRECEKRGITWAYWDFGGNCNVYDIYKEKWERGLLKALIQ